jgi:hypothetical protein
VDADIAQLIDTIIERGGHVGLVIVIFFGYRAVKYAQECADLLRGINSSLADQRKEQREEFTEIHEDLRELSREIHDLR